jgi:hypothetical protein
LTAYPDGEYQQEFNQAPANVQTIPSVSGANAANIPGPLYKWVRINAVTEKAIGTDVNRDGALDNVTPLFYDTGNAPKPSLIVPSPPGANPGNGNTGWNGIILVIGKGTVNGNGRGNNSFNGAIFVANTLDSSGHELASLGPASFNINGGGGSGINYNSCWVNNAQQPPTYKVLSFLEIPYRDANI